MSKSRYTLAKQITLIGALVNTLLGVFKLIGGLLFHSHALIADSLHSFSDLITDVMVLFAAKYSSQDADSAHPYGHQRFETAATLLLALLLIITGLSIGWDALNVVLANHPQIKPSWQALAIALLSIALNELLFRITQLVGKKIQSALILVNAWHHRSDAASSAVVAVGLLGSLAGFPYLDAIAAIIVGILVIKMGLTYGWNSVKELVDTAVDPEIFTKIEQVISQFDSIKKMHQLRTRLMGGDILIDVHILVSSYISVSEGHFIAQNLHYRLLNQLPRVKDVTIHVDSEDDEIADAPQLPSRQVLEASVLNDWRILYPAISYYTLHYLKNRICIDLVCGHLSDEQQTKLEALITADLAQFPCISKVCLLQEIKHITARKNQYLQSQEV